MNKARADKRLRALARAMMEAPIWPHSIARPKRARWAIARDSVVEAWRCYLAGSKGAEQYEQLKGIYWRSGEQGRRKLMSAGLIQQEPKNKEVAA